MYFSKDAAKRLKWKPLMKRKILAMYIYLANNLCLKYTINFYESIITNNS